MGRIRVPISVMIGQGSRERRTCPVVASYGGRT